MAKQKKSVEEINEILEISGKIRVFHANLQTEVAKLGVKKKLTDSDLAGAFNFTVNQIQKWEGGETDVPARYLFAIHRLQQSLDEFFDSGRVTIPQEALRELFTAQELDKSILAREMLQDETTAIAEQKGTFADFESHDRRRQDKNKKGITGTAPPRRTNKRHS